MDAAGTGIPIGFNPLRCLQTHDSVSVAHDIRSRKNKMSRFDANAKAKDLLNAAVNKSHRRAPAQRVYCSLLNGGSALPVHVRGLTPICPALALPSSHNDTLFHLHHLIPRL